MMRMTWTKLAAILIILILALPARLTGGFAEAAPEVRPPVTIAIETAESGESRIEYVYVEGLDDADVQELLNAYLRWFSTDTFLDEDVDRAWDTVEGKTAYALLGGRYLSVRTEYFFSGASIAHPWADIQALVFDLTTGEPDTQLSDYLTMGEALRSAILNGTFTMINPVEASEDFLERFAEDYLDNADPEYYNIDFYLTDDGVGLFLRDRIHAEGDYWAIEAPFNKLDGLATTKLTNLLAGEEPDYADLIEAVRSYMEAFMASDPDNFTGEADGVVVSWPSQFSMAVTEQEIGYALRDLNGDGVEELIWLTKDLSIWAVFTWVDNAVTNVDEYWERHSLVLDQEGTFNIDSSSGAADNIYEVSILIPGSAELQLIEAVGSESVPSATEPEYFRIDGDGVRTTITREEYSAYVESRYSLTNENSGLEFIPLF
ncbi:MAG: hypothetical protein LBB86_00440 [Oscillospiraceae bacterium]|jgi:hypothetical protein|nr:hypothetical protein [Oscillospiraceae bacterium]